MIYTNSRVTVQNYASMIDKKILLYQGDKNIEIQFEILKNEFKQYKTQGTNVIENLNASYAQLIIKRPDASPIVSPITPTKDGKVIFVINGDDIDEVSELGVYDFQIRLFNETQASRVSLPPVVGGIEVLNPLINE